MSSDWNINDFLNGLTRAQRQRAIPAGLRAVDRFGEHVLGQAQQIAPVKTGALQNSATSEPARIVGDDISKTIGFNTDYAAAVHERLELHHNQGQAKYLETAMRTQARKLGPLVESEMKRAL